MSMKTNALAAAVIMAFFLTLHTGTASAVYTVTISPDGSGWAKNDVAFTLAPDPSYATSYYTIINSTASCPSSGYTTGKSGTVTCASGQVCDKSVCYFIVSTLFGIKKSSPFVIDKALPATTIAPDGSPCSGDDAPFYLSCSDAGSGCSATHFKVIDANGTCGTSGFSSGGFGVVPCPEGSLCEKRVCHYSEDAAGNAEPAKVSGVFVVDKSHGDLPCFACPDGKTTYEFSDGTVEELIEFHNGGGTNNSAKVSLPMDMVVTSAYLDVTGICIQEVGEKDFDSVLVTDVSGSMGTGGKMDAAKNADKAFVAEALKNPANKVGLVSFETALDSFMGLTGSKPALDAEINSYAADGCTCISCGLDKAIDVIKPSTKEKYVILMSDGVANTVIGGGGCSASGDTAKIQAIDKAKEAWNNGITVYTVGFGSDVDAATLQQIAAEGHGQYYFATTFNVTAVYQQIALDVSESCPLNPTLNVGDEGPVEWHYTGEFTSTETVPDFASALNGLLPACSCPGCAISGGDCVIDLTATSEAAGYLLLKGLHMSYRFEREVNCTNGVDEDCDSLIDRDDPDCWVCGNDYVDFNETCEMPGTPDNPLCPQENSTCYGAKLGLRDGLGSCGTVCGCVDDPFAYSCVAGECGAECSSQSDYQLDGYACNYECDPDETCSYQGLCSTEAYCDGGTRHYNGSCTATGCIFDSENCEDYDYYNDFEYYCDGSAIRRHKLFHDFSCSPGGCVNSTAWTNDELFEDCGLQNGWYGYGNEAGPNDPACEYRSHYCLESETDIFCAINVTESHDYDGLDGSYCVDGNESVETRDYYCDASGGAAHEVTQGPADCGTEYWSGGGDDPGFGEDPACEYTDYYCVDDGLADHCASSVARTVDYDFLDNGDLCDLSKLFRLDYYCDLPTCDGPNPENGCNHSKVLYNMGCSSLFCGAECETDGDCPNATCEETYYDNCSDRRLVDYNGDTIKNSITVTGSVERSCLASCSCSGEQADCSPPEPGEYCVEGLCEAECDEASDFRVSGTTCYYGCDPGISCLYQGSGGMEDHCEANAWFHSASCSASGVTFQQENCSALDYTDPPERYCDGGEAREHALHHEFVCSPEGCQETTYWIDDRLVEDCDLLDGTIENECGVEDWTCVEEVTAECAVRDITPDDSFCTDRCDGGARLFNGYCGQDFYCHYDEENCQLLDGSYCVDGFVEAREYYCTSSLCQYRVTDVITCPSDAWYGYGNAVGGDDPACELRDYYCLDDGLNDRCAFNVSESHDYDGLDGSYCVDGNESVETRDYYCNASGQAAYGVTSGPTDCGSEYWSGGGDDPGFGDDPACEYTDYYCVDDGLADHCASSVARTVDYDFLDNGDSDACLGSVLIPIDYWCDVSTCDGQAPERGCNYSKTLHDYGCNMPLCGAECETDGDCPDDSCQQTYNDYCDGNRLTEYDDDRVKDFTTVADSVENLCLGSCLCTREQADCSPPPTNTYCVEGVCEASCDSPGDFRASGTACYYGCGWETDCSYAGYASMGSYCDGSVRHFGAECTASGAVFQTEDCDGHDYYGEWESYCQQGKVYRHRLFHDFSCSPTGCTEYAQWSQPEMVEDCNALDGSVRNDCGIEHWACTEVNSTQAACEISSITKDGSVCEAYCDNGARYYGAECGDDYYCTDFQEENCSAYGGSYCAGNAVETRNYYCTPSACKYTVTSTATCLPDGWYNYGNAFDFDDPACELRDYYCLDDGLNDRCAFNVNESRDYDFLDGSYCMNSNRAVEGRDYYCNSSGQAAYLVTEQPHDCGQEEWSGGGNVEGFGEDPACLYTDYYCVDYGTQDYCTSATAQVWDFDYMDDPFSCSGARIGKLDYWCEPSTCDPITPSNGCHYGSRHYDLRCSQACGGECGTSGDCPAYLNGATCYHNSACSEGCLCEYQTSYCPEPGTVHEGACYFGLQECGQEGCTLDSCALGPGQACDPSAGCLTCQGLGTILTAFSDGSSEKELWFPPGGGHDTSASIKLPRSVVITGSSLSVTGMPTYLTSEKKIDAVLVTDVSSSMTGEKLAQAKAADLEFVNAVLGPEGNANNIGLVSFSTRVEAFLSLTNSTGGLESHINGYKPRAMTCISCGIIKATELLSSGWNGNRVMVVMSDGVDNQAPGRVVPKAREAWEVYGIHVFTVAFGQDADRDMLEEAAQAGNGKFYYADTDTIVDIYRKIAIQVTSSHPSDPSLNMGSDGLPEWQHAGDFDNLTETLEFTDAANSILSACTCPGCQTTDGGCLIGLDAFSSTNGGLRLSDLSVDACSYYPGENIKCDSCSDCGGGEDCAAYGAWSEWECAWQDVCDREASCARSREATHYACQEPGTINSFCSSSVDVQTEGKAETRVTDGLSCDDGLFCTVYDQCEGGLCSGPARACSDGNECTDDTCDESADACAYVNDDTNPCGLSRACPSSQCMGYNWTVYPPDGHDFCSAGACTIYSCGATASYYSEACAGEEDSDGDGIPDAQDACPAAEGYGCNGCPDPCTGCAVMLCPASGQPTCGPDEGLCGPTACPADGCGLGSCESWEWADYPDQAGNACSVSGYEGACTQNSCEGLEACTPSADCGWEGNETDNVTEEAKVLFTEVAYDTESAGEEWIELYNPGNASVDVSGWQVRDNAGTYTVPEGTVIPAGETMVLARDLAAFYLKFGAVPDLDDLTLGLNNDGDVLYLFDGDTEMDMVAWESYVEGWAVYASRGKTIQRSPMDHDTNSPSDWIGNQDPDPNPYKETRHYTLEVATDGQYYEPSMAVNVTGRLLNVTGDGLPGETVAVNISVGGTPVVADSLATDGEGNFSFSLTIQETFALGSYVITASFGGEEGSSAFEVLECLDCDGDGYDFTADCDDSRAGIHPGAPETCNGKDDDCDGHVDEGVCGGGTTGGDTGGYQSTKGGAAAAVCAPAWSCTEWSGCVDGARTRACTDANDCGTETGKPPETEGCEAAGRVCQPYEIKCSEKDVLHCSPEGDHWIIVETCDAACQDGRCVEPLEFNISAAPEGNVTEVPGLTGGVFLTPTQTLAAVIIALLVIGGLVLWKFSLV